MMHLYAAAPMSHVAQFNIPAIDRAAADLRERGYVVTSPAELDSQEVRDACLASPDGELPQTAQGETWGELLARDIVVIADEGVEAIVVLPGWERSKGARLETFVGRLLGLPILAYPHLNPVERKELQLAHEVNADKSRLVPLFECGVVPSPPGHPLNISTMEVPLDTAESVQCDQEVRVKDTVTGGEKGSKLAALGDLDPKALMELAKVAGFGRKKYERLNYSKGFDWSLSYDALQRHLHAFWAREEADQESKLPHLAHAAWHCLTLLCFAQRRRGNDNRMEL